MFRKIFRLFLLTIIFGISSSNCVPPTAAPTVAPAACPPMAGPITANVPTPGDVSSITVPDGTTGEYDGGGYWCTPGDLSISKVDVNNLITQYGCFSNRSDKIPPCTVTNALAAVDVQPSPVKFNSSPKPSLRYDLSVTQNKPVCMTEGTSCGGYWFYQLKDPVPATGVAWRSVGQATLGSYGGKSVAQGDINHFSTFALVELPLPQAIGPMKAQMIVDSDFLPDDQKGIRVAFEIVSGDLPLFGETRLFRFSGVDPVWANADLPPECKNLGSLEEQLTCFLPIGTPVELEVDANNFVRIISPSLNAPVEFYALVEIY